MKPPLLFLAHRVPWPPEKGDKIRSLRWITALAEDYDLHVGAFAESRAESEAASALEEFAVEVAVFPRPSRMRAVRALFTGRSPSEEVFRSVRLSRWVARTLTAVRPVAAIGFSSTMAQYLPPGELPCLLDLVDVDSAKWESYGRRGLLGPLYRLEARRLKAREGRILRDFDRVTVISAAEAARLPAGERKPEVLPNGVDSEVFAPGDPEERVPGRIVFTGAMDYRLNVEGACWFAREAWPGIRERAPGATFTIVGSNPSRSVRRLGRLPGVEVTGRVPEIRTWLHRAEVAVAPLSRAFGVQNKVLEAMACGLPVVATPAAAEGIDADPDRHLVVAEGCGAFVRETAGLLGDAGRRRELGRAARKRVVGRYRWEPVMERMREIVGACAKEVTG